MSTATTQPGKSPKIKRLPLRDLGLNNLVAVPYILSISEPLHTALRVGMRQVEIIPAQYGLSNSYTINGTTATAYEFMYGKKPSHLISYAIHALQHSLLTEGEDIFKAIYDPHAEFHKHTADAAPVDTASLTQLSLDSPEQFAMAWTKFEGLDEIAKPYLPDFVASLTDADAATKQFWPTIGNHSFVHNFIVLEKIRDAQAESIKQRFGDAWGSEGMEASYKEGNLFALDLTVFDAIASTAKTASGRYTHATFTVLRRDPKTKALEPVAVWISGKNVDGRPRIYTRAKATSGAWLYALQAVKVSVTVCGIFLRHVYLWHVVPATMQMTMYNTLPTKHPVYQLMAPQSKYTIALDETLLLLWQAGKPSSSLDTALQYLKLCDEFAKDRGFYDDDPKVAIERLGLREEEFSTASPWDGYATVKDSLELWDATEKYADTCVDTIYQDDAAVAKDQALQAWIAASGSVDQGNVQGLEPLKANRRSSGSSPVFSFASSRTAGRIWCSPLSSSTCSRPTFLCASRDETFPNPTPRWIRNSC